MSGENLRRIDKIVALNIRSRVANCQGVYLKKFDEKLSNMDQGSVQKVNELLAKAEDHVKSDEYPENQVKKDAERSYNAVSYEIRGLTDLSPEYIYNSLLEVAKDDQDAKYLKPVENERTGVPSLNREKFDNLLETYVSKPCLYCRENLGPNIMEPIMFDYGYGHQIMNDRADFYETWLKYELCYGTSTIGHKGVVRYSDEQVV